MSFKLTQQEVTGWCQHNNFKALFSGRTNAIVGPNGSGKSNFFNAGVTALTGECVVGTIEQNIKFDQDVAEIATGFEIQGTRGEVVRTFRGRRSVTQDPVTGLDKPCRVDVRTEATLTFGNDNKLKGVKAVNARLGEILGVSRQVIADHVFVPQTDLSKMIKATGNMRMDTFLKMLPGVGVAEIRSQAIAEELRRFPRETDLGPIRDGVVARQKEIIAELQRITDALVVQRKELEALDEPALNAVLAADRAAVAVNAEIRQLTAQRDRQTAEVEALRVPLQQLVQQHTAMAGDLNDPDVVSAVEAARTSLAGAAAAKRNYDELQGLKRKLAEAEEQLAAMTPPEPCEFTRDQIDELDKAIGPLQAELTSAEKTVRFIRTWNGQGDLICSSCQTRIADPKVALQTNADLARKLSAEIQPMMERRAAMWKAIDAHAYAQGKYEQNLAAWKTNVDQLRQRVTGRPEVVPPTDAEIAAWSEDIRYYDAQKLEERKLSENRARKQQEFDSKASALLHTEHDLELALSRRVDAPSQADVVIATNLLQRAANIRTEIAGLEGQQTPMMREAPQLESQLKEIDARIERGKKLDAYSRILERARELLHRDCLPKEVFSTFLAGLNYWCNSFLGQFGRPFAVTLDKNMDIECAFPSGYVSMCDRLSGGQACVLSVALRFATNRQFASKMGMLGMDEPTEYMDQANRQMMADFMKQVQVMCAESGLQTMIITHAMELLPAFDNVIEVK